MVKALGCPSKMALVTSRCLQDEGFVEELLSMMRKIGYMSQLEFEGIEFPKGEERHWREETGECAAIAPTHVPVLAPQRDQPVGEDREEPMEEEFFAESDTEDPLLGYTPML
ncbi:hypothetical protein GUJ93_ZPchr0009g1108 [Zizania palustris]|uniref:Uncharacterized protein n=1 Tax=Zizania palustris TaxID=103762 RepID=A0A8J5RWY1_ZIZPA|nr:hypothetical protein GUJ93_ZPchr0009g1108 [Zizania palustris]